MSLNINDYAPQFVLKDSDGNDTSLEQYRGKPVLLLFFPLAFTGVCTKELCTVRDNMNVYEKINAQVLAISVDSFFTLSQFKKQQNLNFPLLSDFNKDISKAYGAYYDEFFGMHGVSKRSAFVIDKDGKIRYAEVLDKASDLPDFDKIQSVIEHLN